MNRGPFSPGVGILAGGALLLALFLLVGYLLPSDWDVEVTTRLAAPPDAVWPLLDSPEGWQRWTPWPESGVTRSGPGSGPGASLAWDDPELGSGSFTIAETADRARVAYAVSIEEGTIRANGTVELVPEEGGTRVRWRERGDFGWNPLMGYWALSMERAQRDEMTKGLDRLRALVTAPADAPVGVGGDSVSSTP
jgi:uncharacterized protein YndB with AHSA1/START domain